MDTELSELSWMRNTLILTKTIFDIQLIMRNQSDFLRMQTCRNLETNTIAVHLPYPNRTRANMVYRVTQETSVSLMQMC